MLIYEVDVRVDGDVAEEYGRWLEPHIQQILTLPGFTGARLLAPEQGIPPSEGRGRARFIVQYELRDAASLRAYLDHHAPALRRDGERRFPGRFRVTRRVLRVVGTFEARP